MASTMVTVGGTESEEQTPVRDERSRSVILTVGGLVAGLLLGVLFTGSGPVGDDAPQDTTVGEPAASPTTNPPSTTITTIEVVPSRLATMVPGMLDVLVAGAVDRNSAQVVTTWEPSGRAPTVEPLPWGAFTPDASATWLASGTTNRWVAGSTLWVGNTVHVEPVTSSLASPPVWHTRFPGELAWLEDVANGRELKTARFVPGQPAIPRTAIEVDDTTNLVGWIDTGFLMTRSDSEGGVLELWNDVGEVLATVEVSNGLAPIAVGRSLVFATDVDGTGILLDQDLNPVGNVPWGSDCHRAVWGPNGSQVALHCGFGDEQRFEFWQDPVRLTVPQFVHTGEEYADLGFTTNAIPYVVTIESLRPSSTIIFFPVADQQPYEVEYPGLVQWLATVRG